MRDEEERQQRIAQALWACWMNTQTREDCLLLAAECGMKDLFDKEIADVRERHGRR